MTRFSIMFFLYSIIAAAIFLSFTACSQPQTGMTNSNNLKEVTPIKISLLGKNNKDLASLTDPKKTSQVITIINSRKPLLEKIMPIFKMQIIIEKKEEKEIWLFAKPGYLQQKSTENNQVYYIDKDNQLLKILLD